MFLWTLYEHIIYNESTVEWLMQLYFVSTQSTVALLDLWFSLLLLYTLYEVGFSDSTERVICNWCCLIMVCSESPQRFVCQPIRLKPGFLAISGTQKSWLYPDQNSDFSWLFVIIHKCLSSSTTKQKDAFPVKGKIRHFKTTKFLSLRYSPPRRIKPKV